MNAMVKVFDAIPQAITGAGLIGLPWLSHRFLVPRLLRVLSAGAAPACYACGQDPGGDPSGRGPGGGRNMKTPASPSWTTVVKVIGLWVMVTGCLLVLPYGPLLDLAIAAGSLSCMAVGLVVWSHATGWPGRAARLGLAFCLLAGGLLGLSGWWYPMLLPPLAR